MRTRPDLPLALAALTTLGASSLALAQEPTSPAQPAAPAQSQQGTTPLTGADDDNAEASEGTDAQPNAQGPGDARAQDQAGAEGESTESEGEGEQAAAPSEPPPPSITPEQEREIGPAPGEVPERDISGHRRVLIPPFMYEWGRGYHTTVLFPVYFHVNRREENYWLVPPYFRVRTPRLAGDVFFPFYARYRGEEADGTRWATDVVLNSYWHFSRGPERAHAASVGIAPLFFYGETFGRNGRLEREHLIIPPLLTYHRWWSTGQTTVAGPYFYVRDRSAVTWGLAPFVFGHSTSQATWTALPLLLSYRRVDHIENRAFTLVGPVWSESGPNLFTLNIAPFLFHARDRDSSRTTFVPLFHTERGREHFTLVTPLGGYTRSSAGSTLVLPLYQNHRGDYDLDAVAPLFVSWRNPRLGASALSAGLIFFHSQSPTGYSWVLFPLVGHFHEYGRYSTIATPLFVHSNVMATRSRATWVFPVFHAESSPSHSLFNIYPLLWTARGRDWHHTVFVPFFADIANRTTGQHILITPLYGRVASRTNVTQWVFPLNFFWASTRMGEHSWGMDIDGLFQYGRPRAGDVYWSVLYGLVGYRRQGSYEQLRVLYIPFTLSGTPPASSSSGSSGANPEPGTSQARRGHAPNDVLLEL